VGVANVLRDTAWPNSRNGNDSTPVPVKTTSRLQNQAAKFVGRSKGLNLRADSNRRSGVTFLTAAQNKFIIRLRWSEAASNFQTTLRRYADK
jgi:hypothetical protein